MKILILGGGLIGVCSAYFLQKSGHNVTVIERQNDVGLETSFANGGQISVSYAEPWSNFNNLKKIITWIGNENSPLLYRPKLDTHQLLWSLQFLYQSFPKNYHNSIEKLLNLAIFSRKELKKLREELNLDYQQIEKGILTFYTSMESFSNAKKLAIFANTFGAERVIKNINETLDIEPSLKYSKLPIIGSDYTEKDETGNAFLFLQKLKIECEKIGVNFLFNSEIQDVQINQNKRSIDKIFYKKNSYLEEISADSYVLSLGSYSYLFAKKINIYFPIYPVKGYSITFPILENKFVNEVSLSDSDKKIVFTKLGNELRVAGTADFDSYNLDINKKRVDMLISRVKEILPLGLDCNHYKVWTGLRPTTPNNVPYIGKTKYKNLFINSGHGTLGWTLSVGSGKLIEQIINHKELYT